MEPSQLMMDLTRWCVRAALMTMVAVLTASATAQSANPDELREQAAQLERKARDLKADGRGEDARQVMRESEELAKKAAALEMEKRREKGGEDRPRGELKAELQKLRAHLKELAAAGNREEAAEVKRRVGELERQLGVEPAPERRALEPRESDQPRVGRRPRPGPDTRPEGPRGEGDRIRPLGPTPRQAPEGGPEAERRAQHVQVAIDNLHAAGLHEAAERLAQGIEQRRSRPMDRPANRPGFEPGRPAAPLAELRRLRAEVQELRQALQELRQQLERQGRERR